MIRRGGGRRSVLVVVLLVLGVGACTTTEPAPCRAPEADVATVPGWVGYLTAHPDDVAFVFDDGRGTRVEHTFSDNAAPDFLRARLGDRALHDAAREYGWGEVGVLPSNTGFLLGVFVPEIVPVDAAPAERRRLEWDVARRYAVDPAFRADLDTRQVPPGLDEYAYNGSGPGGTARQLTALWRAIGEGRLPGATHARAITEQSTRPGYVGVGAKGGLTTGAVVSRGTELRRADGSVATGVLLVRRMPRADTDRVGTTPGLNDVAAAVADDPDLVRRLGCDTFLRPGASR